MLNYGNSFPLKSNVLMRITSDGFRLRPYGLTELAQAYFPAHTPGGARRALLAWIDNNQELRQMLHRQRDGGNLEAVRRGRCLTLTPRQVERIVELLGEP